MDHHSHGSSSLPRRIACTASYLAEQQCDELPESEDASFGTICHNILEWCIKGGWDAFEYLDQVDAAAPDDKLELVQQALDRVREVVPGRLWDKAVTEQRVYFGSDVVPTPTLAFGTGDIFHPDYENRILYVSDAKFGHRYVAADSYQLMALAIGADQFFTDFFDDEPAFDTFSLNVLQPTLDSFPSLMLNRGELYDWGLNDCRPKVLEGLDPKKAEYNPDAGVCTYCNARAKCPARIEKLKPLYEEGVLDYLLEHGEWPVMFEDAPVLSDKVLAELVPDVKIIERLMKDVTAHMTNEVKNGTVEVPGYVIGRKKTHRKFSAGVTAEALRTQFGLLATQVQAEPKLKSPNQIMAQLPADAIDPEPRKRLAELIYKPPGDFTLVPAADAPERPELVAGLKTKTPQT